MKLCDNFSAFNINIEDFVGKKSENKYTMDPGPQIYLSNNIKKFWSKNAIFHKNAIYLKLYFAL